MLKGPRNPQLWSYECIEEGSGVSSPECTRRWTKRIFHGYVPSFLHCLTRVVRRRHFLGWLPIIQASTLQIRRGHFLMLHPRGHQHNPCSTTASYVSRAMVLWRWKLTRYDHRPQGELVVCGRVSIGQAELAHEMRNSPARSSESPRSRPYTSCEVTPVSLYHLL